MTAMEKLAEEIRECNGPVRQNEVKNNGIWFISSDGWFVAHTLGGQVHLAESADEAVRFIRKNH